MARSGRDAHTCVRRRSRLPQYLVRALIYRVVTDRLFRLDESPRPDDQDRYALPVALAIAVAS